MAIDLDYLDQISKLENLHMIQLFKVENDESVYLAKFDLETLPDETQILERFESGVYSFRAVYFKEEAGERKRSVKSFKLGKIGLDKKGVKKVDEEVKQLLQVMANSVQQNSEAIAKLAANQTQSSSPSDMLLSKLLDKSLQSDNKNMEFFFQGMNTAMNMQPEKEESGGFMDGLGAIAERVFGGGGLSGGAGEDVATPSALDDLT